MAEESFVLSPIIDPQTDSVLEQRIAIPYTTTQPTFTPRVNGVRRIYNDGTDYWLYVYANGAWRSQKLGIGKFGGTGADGALSISSGTTTIDLANAAFVTRNYTSISITGTGVLAFSNPHANGTVIILKSQGNVAITSSTNPAINASSMGAAGGSSPGTTSAGVAGNDGSKSVPTQTIRGQGGTFSNTTTSVSASVNAAIPVWTAVTLVGKIVFVSCGGGGGAGARGNTPNGASGNGGRGGGGIYIECGGALNFTSTVSVAAANGTNSQAANDTARSGPGGGAGGAGGSFIIIYNTLTANTGTVTVTGGNGGNGGADDGAGDTRASGGGNGGSNLNNLGGVGGGVDTRNGADGSAGAGTGAGTGGTGGTNTGGGAGGGAAGWSAIISNTELI